VTAAVAVVAPVLWVAVVGWFGLHSRSVVGVPRGQTGQVGCVVVIAARCGCWFGQVVQTGWGWPLITSLLVQVKWPGLV
jgi:hypothetical protein